MVVREHVNLTSVVFFGCPPPCSRESNDVIRKTGYEEHVDDAKEDEVGVCGALLGASLSTGAGRGWRVAANRGPKRRCGWAQAGAGSIVSPVHPQIGYFRFDTTSRDSHFH